MTSSMLQAIKERIFIDPPGQTTIGLELSTEDELGPNLRRRIAEFLQGMGFVIVEQGRREFWIVSMETEALSTLLRAQGQTFTWGRKAAFKVVFLGTPSVQQATSKELLDVISIYQPLRCPSCKQELPPIAETPFKQYTCGCGVELNVIPSGIEVNK